MWAGIYKHYKGGYYQVLGIAEHTETKERLVVYISLTGFGLAGPRIRCRPFDGPEGFTTQVDGKDRFTYVGTEFSLPQQ